MKSTAVIYAFFDRPDSRTNLIFFFKNGYIDSPNIDYFVIVNEDPHQSREQLLERIPKKTNVNVVFQENKGYDFAGYKRGIQEAMRSTKSYDYYLFLNASSRGPFFTPQFPGETFLQRFQSLLNNTVKLVGPTINLTTWTPVTQGAACLPHVQSYTMMMDSECLEYVWSKGIFQREYADLLNVIKYQEIALSSLVLHHNWNISCLVPEYQNTDYRTLNYDINAAHSVNGDILYKGGHCFGRDVSPHEIMFIKSNREMFLDIQNKV